MFQKMLSIPIATSVLSAGVLAASLGGAAMSVSAHDDDRRMHFKAKLRGKHEVPPVRTRTVGVAKFSVNRRLTRIAFDVHVRVRGRDVGLLGAAGAHIHCAPAGENGPAVAFLPELNATR